MAENFKYAAGEEFPYQYKYEHMAVTTDCVIFTYEERELKVLLIRRGAEPFEGEWALPGGFLRMDESAKAGALRELEEETGLGDAAIRELGVFSDVDRDPRERTITLAWYALVRHSEVVGGDDAAEAAWFSVNDLPSLAFDHDKILKAAMERLKRDIHFEPVGFELLDERFTIPDLQRLYEIILGREFDRRNFQRKLLSTGILRADGEERRMARGEDGSRADGVGGSIGAGGGGGRQAGPAMFMALFDSAEGIYGEVNALGEASGRGAEMSRGEACEDVRGRAEEASRARAKKSTAGRKAVFWKLNTSKYDELKKDGGNEF